MIVFETAAAFIASIMLAVNCDVSRSELILCGFGGLTAESIYQITKNNDSEEVFAVFAAAAAVTALARILANIRRMPVPTYLISGIIPLVPGAGMYNTVFNLIASDYKTAVQTGFATLTSASAVAVGIILIFALPNRLFLKKRK